jgi:hypothetical protein
MTSELLARQLDHLRVLVRDALIAQFGESYHEMSWYVAYLFGSKRPWRVIVGECHHRTAWSGQTRAEVLMRFKANIVVLSEADLG